MTIVKNPILKALQDIVGIAPEPAPLVIDTGNASLTVPILPDLARYSLSGPDGGFITGVMENVHSAADDERSQLDPYIAGAAALGSFPSPVPAGFDLWLLSASLTHSGGAAAVLVGALLAFNPGPERGWGIDDAGAQVTATPRINMVFWDTLNTDTAGTNGVGLTEQGLPFTKIGVRLPRGGNLIFDSTTAGATELSVIVIMQLVPSALGQDIVT